MRYAIAKPVNGATPDFTRERIALAHSLNINLNPKPIPSRAQIKRNMPETRKTTTLILSSILSALKLFNFQILFT